MTFHVFTGVLPMVGGKAEKEDEEMANQSKLCRNCGMMGIHQLVSGFRVYDNKLS